MDAKLNGFTVYITRKLLHIRGRTHRAYGPLTPGYVKLYIDNECGTLVKLHFLSISGHFYFSIHKE